MRARIEPLDGCMPTIIQSAMHPFTMRCCRCGLEWEPQPAKGKEITAHRLDTQAKKHMQECGSYG